MKSRIFYALVYILFLVNLVSAQTCPFWESEPNDPDNPDSFDAESCESVEINGDLRGSSETDFFIFNNFESLKKGNKFGIANRNRFSAKVFLFDDEFNLYSRGTWSDTGLLPYDIPNTVIGLWDVEENDETYVLGFETLGEEQPIEVGQKVYVDFDYEGIIRVGNSLYASEPFDITEYDGASDWDNEDAKQQVKEKLLRIFNRDWGNLEIIFSDEEDSPNPPLSTLYIVNANDNDQGLLGIASYVDHLNQNKGYRAVVFLDSVGKYISWGYEIEEITDGIASIGAHEVGHLLGLDHTEFVPGFNAVMAADGVANDVFEIDTFKRNRLAEDIVFFPNDDLLYQDSVDLLTRLFSCENTCEPEIHEPFCTNDIQYIVCGEFDRDTCYDRGIVTCESGYLCDGGECVENLCEADEHCPGDLVCQQRTGTCVEKCFTNDDCNVDYPWCDGLSGECVECRGGCPEGEDFQCFFGVMLFECIYSETHQCYMWNLTICDDSECESGMCLPDSGACSDECEEGETGCGENERWECGEAGDGDACLDKVYSMCGFGENCQEGECVCFDQCELGTKECLVDDDFVECLLNPATGCTEWKVEECSDGTNCIEDGICVGCSPSDGGSQPLEFGITKVINQDGTEEEFEDQCLDGNTVKEYHCGDDKQAYSVDYDCDVIQESTGCVNGRCETPCELTDISWEKEWEVETITVNLYLTGTIGCDDKLINFDIFESETETPARFNPESVIFDKDLAVARWEAERISGVDTTWYFNAILDEDPSNVFSSAEGTLYPQLTVVEPFCGDGYCFPDENCLCGDCSCPSGQRCSGGLCIIDSSFLAGTKIMMTDGKEKNIEDLKIGDKVLSFDEKREEKVEGEVSWIGKYGGYGYYVLNGEIMVTGTHPFFVSGEWIDVQDLKIGDVLLDDSKRSREISSIEYIEQSVEVYNLHVKGFENYFAEGVLVHNKRSDQEDCEGLTEQECEKRKDCQVIGTECSDIVVSF